MSAPKNKRELFRRLAEIIEGSPYTMPEEKYTGTGGPGLYLEDLLELTTGSADIPDSMGWELKYYTDKTSLITLFHKEPQPAGVIRYMVSRFGWKDRKDRLSFRHTIGGRSDRFRVDADSSTEDDILSAAGAKLRRLVLVRGKRNGQEVSFDRIDCFENLQLSFFIYEVVTGCVKIDFDARESTPGSKGLRNHGTKFRVSPNDICRLYAKKERLI